jgi:NAD(P)-dependent dehydrogenase (short-subunit alcohol dehydrogenase family)
VSEAVIGPGRVAVVTGAASGIGLALSQRLLWEGMRVVLADVEGPALADTAERLAGAGEVLPVACDVSVAADVDALRDRAVEAFGAVHLLCSNAGVAGVAQPVWETGLGDWEWISVSTCGA